MKTITIDNIEYELVPVSKPSSIRITETLDFEVYPNDLPKLMDWEDAKKAAAELGNGWRLPTREELLLMYKHKDRIPNLNTSGSWPAGYYWSSTPVCDDVAWVQNFDDGIQGTNDRSGEISVRCVRSSSELNH